MSDRRDLTFAELRQANLRRIPQFKDAHGRRSHSEDDGSDWSDSDWLMAVTGELGELANLRKKVLRGDLSMKEAQQQIAYEFADVVIYLDIAAMRMGVDLGEAVREKFDIVSERVGANVFLGRNEATPKPSDGDAFYADSEVFNAWATRVRELEDIRAADHSERKKAGELALEIYMNASLLDSPEIKESLGQAVSLLYDGSRDALNQAFDILVMLAEEAE